MTRGDEGAAIRRGRRRMVRGDVVDLAAETGLHVYVGVARSNETFELVDSIDGFLQNLGLPSGIELSEEHWTSLIHPDDVAGYDAAFHFDRLALGPCECAYRVLLADGVELDVVERIVPRERLPDGSLRCVGIIEDVSRERRAERRAQRTAESLGVSFWEVQVAPDGSWRSTVPGDRTLPRDPVVERLLGGAPPAGAAHDVWWSLIHPDDRQVWLDAFVRQHAEGDRVALEYRLVGFDGQTRAAFESGIVRSVLADGTAYIEGVVIDVTERRAAADARRVAEQRIDRITSTLNAYTYEGVVDAHGGYVEVGDPEAVARFLGIDPPDPDRLEDAWVGQIHPDDVPLYVGWEGSFLDRTGFLEYRMVRGDGTTMTVAEWSFATTGEDGLRYLEGVVLDVTDASETRLRAESAERRLHAILANVDVLVATVVLRPDGTRDEAFRGPGAAALLGPEADAAPDLLALVGGLAGEPGAAAIAAALARAAYGEEGEARVRIRVGDRRLVIRVRLHPRGPERADGAVEVDCVLADVTEEERVADDLARARDDAERRLRTDYLTGVASRAFAVAELDRMLDVPGAHVAAALLDIDHFKKVNDVHLHAGGDAVLRAVAGRLAASHGGLVARFGGEEFLVVAEVPRGADPRHGIEMLRRSVGAAPIRLAGDELVQVTLSAGLVIAEAGASAEAVLASADRALHAAKRRGRDRLVQDVEIDPEELLADDPEVLRLAEAMSRAVGEHEGEPELHCRRVSELAGEVAAELGLGATCRLRCRAAGLIHDIGKIAVPRTILRKPGPLDPDERLVMQEHPAVGAQIVAGIGLLADAAPAVRHHHERWDGGGYPDGLAGAAIPIEARIVAAVDAWSAMTEERVYRSALSPAEGVLELGRAAGGQLDPDVVAALVRVLERSRVAGGDGPRGLAPLPRAGGW